MSSCIQSSLLPNISGTDVREAIAQCYLAKGYEQLTDRLVFDCRYNSEEVRVFVVSNEQWSVVLASNDIEETSERDQILGRFPAVVQLWAMDGGWGFCLNEYGKPTTVFSSQRRLEASASQAEDLALLASICGVSSVVQKLESIKSGRFLFAAKPCTEFADALNAPVGALNFHDLDIANAGFVNERLVSGWKCQMCCFVKVPADLLNSPESIRQFEATPALDDQDRKDIVRLQRKMKWVGFMVWPIALLGGLLVIPFMACVWVVSLLGNIPLIRRAFLGKASPFLSDFVAELKGLEEGPVLIKGNLVTNVRHGCSITVCPPAKAFTDLLKRMGGFDQPVFAVAIGTDSLSCTAYPVGGGPQWYGVEILETRTFLVEGLEAVFQKRRTTNTKRSWMQYEWSIRSDRATYRFFNTRETEWISQQFEVLETLVRSFKLKRR